MTSQDCKVWDFEADTGSTERFWSAHCAYIWLKAEETLWRNKE